MNIITYQNKRETMASSRKGARMKLCALLVMHTFVMIEMGRKLMPLDFFRRSAAPSETQQSKHIEHRRLFRGKRIPLSSKEASDNKSEQRNAFLEYFVDSFSNDKSMSDTASANNFAALILKNGRVYCRKSQMKSLSRGRYFVQMLQQGLVQYHPQTMITNDNGFPILIKHDDSNGCYPATHKDKYDFPRLTWSIPANTTTTYDQKSWCSAIGMPSYKEWKDMKHKKEKEEGKKDTIKLNNSPYPWSAKLPKAVWRGSTTCNKAMYGHLPLQDIPRSKLVHSSLDRPDLIDAGFHKLVGKYEDIAMNERTSRMLKEAIPLEEMTKYKAIIDIDGNNWSARFHALLCTNSIIIKMAPDFIEQYYSELEPNVHFIPASIDNITEVVEYTLDINNDKQMKNIVKNANEWCLQSRNKEAFARRAMVAFEMYQDAVKHYDGGNWIEEWDSASVADEFDDVVECKI